MPGNGEQILSLPKGERYSLTDIAPDTYYLVSCESGKGFIRGNQFQHKKLLIKSQQLVLSKTSFISFHAVETMKIIIREIKDDR